MKPIKLVGLAILSGGLFAGLVGTASAQNGTQNHNGYVATNAKGFGSAQVMHVNDRDRDRRWSGNNRGNNHNSRGHDNRRNDHRGNRGDNRRHGDWNRGQNNRNYGHNNNRRDHGYNNYRNYGHQNYGNNNRRYYGNNYRYNPPSNYGRHNNYRPRYSWNPGRRVIYAPNYYRPNYRPYYNVGARFYGYDRYRINDYWRWGLYEPPRGHYWVRHNDDAYLAAAGTGLVAGIIIGALAGGY